MVIDSWDLPAWLSEQAVIMAWVDVITRNVRRYIFTPEFIVFWISVYVLVALYYNSPKLWSSEPHHRGPRSPNIVMPDMPPLGAGLGSQHEPYADWYEQKGRVCVGSIQGKRPHMEDRFNYTENVNGSQVSLFSVFDGHGGEFAAEYAGQAVMSQLMREVVRRPGVDEPGALLTSALMDSDERLISIARPARDISGSTALVALQNGDTLYVANVGDSRGVLCDVTNTAVPMSYDHKPHELKERTRIQEAGGFVAFNGVWRVAGILATSRALGDYPLKVDNWVIARPDILNFTVAEARFAVLATDGLWDVFSNQEVVNFLLAKQGQPDRGVRDLISAALRRGSMDNITVMIIGFKNQGLQGEDDTIDNDFQGDLGEQDEREEHVNAHL